METLVRGMQEAAEARQLLESAIVKRNNLIRELKAMIECLMAEKAAMATKHHKDMNYAIVETPKRTLEDALKEGFDIQKNLELAVRQVAEAALECFPDDLGCDDGSRGAKAVSDTAEVGEGSTEGNIAGASNGWNGGCSHHIGILIRIKQMLLSQLTGQ